QQNAAQITFVVDLEAHLSEGTSGVAVPVTIAGSEPCKRRDHILHTRCDGSLRAYMFYHEQCATWFEHAQYLAQSTHWIGDGTEHERCHDTIKCSIGKGQIFRRCLCEIDRHSRRLQALPCI